MKTNLIASLLFFFLAVLVAHAQQATPRPEMFAQYGTFNRPADDGIEHDGPGTGVSVSWPLGGKWRIEGDYSTGEWRSLDQTPGAKGSLFTYSTRWRGHQVSACMLRSYRRGLFELFGGFGAVAVLESQESDSVIYARRPEDGSMYVYQSKHDDWTNRQGPSAMARGGVKIHVTNHLFVRADAESLGLIYPYMWFGVNAGIGVRF